MFGFKKAKPPSPPPPLASQMPSGEPHPQHRSFVRLSIPLALIKQRSGFLFALSSSQGSQLLQQNWQSAGAAILTGDRLLPLTGLSVSSFRIDKHICALIIFPKPKSPGESYFGFIIAGPADDWSPESREKVPVRYFILEQSTTSTPVIFEWKPSASTGEEIFDSLGPGPSPQDPRDFVGKVLIDFCGLNPN